MEKLTTTRKESSSEAWDYLEELVRMKVREFIQTLLEDEVTELLRRGKSERREALDSPPVYRNGYGKRRKLTLGCGTITVRRPRVRGLEERFESRILPLFVRRSKEVNQLIPQLYLHGLAEGDFDLALRGLLGEDAPISASTVARLKEQWQTEWEQWRRRSFVGLELVYLWVDGVYVKAGLEKAKSALLVVIGGLSDGRKVILAVEPGYRESSESWAEVLRDLKGRGLNCPRLVVGDGHLGIWGALSNVYPDALESRCIGTGTIRCAMCSISCRRKPRDWPKASYRGLCTRIPVRWLRPGEMTSSVGAGRKAMTGRPERWSRTGSGW